MIVAGPLFLIGPRGSGKTTVARLLAERLGWNWIDADTELERRAGRTIREVFAGEGEEGFRRREAEVLAELAGRTQPSVIATGGGVILREDNRKVLQQGKVIWLTADAATLWRRISGDPTTAERRPSLLTGADGRSEMEQILSRREPLYRNCAQLTIDTAERTPEQIVSQIQDWLHAGERGA